MTRTIPDELGWSRTLSLSGGDPWLCAMVPLDTFNFHVCRNAYHRGCLLVVPPSLRYLERLWGSIETAKFIFVTVVASNVIAVGLSWIEYVVIGKPELFLFGMIYRGQSALQCGILVAFTQLIPEHQVQLFGVIKVRVKVGSNPAFLCYRSNGTVVSWVWLRFYKRTVLEGSLGGVTTHGDRSETFAFVNWFPPIAHKPVSILSTFVYTYAVRFNLVHPSGSSVPDGNNVELGNGGYAPLPGGARAEAERSAMALKALDQRMAAVSNSQPATQTSISSETPVIPKANHGHASSSSRKLSVTSIPTDSKVHKSDEDSTR
ncbi:eukaryotic integral membrane protein [Rhizoctonia solani AG-1 IA]|uniref:Eukaryotic integral membrane protein n=1 Tax=Thanatephorus cucumeris (strain AG1-IA) TaxID=983506 RepID=L8WSY8_THACA|nr:eukaryotic integral membrane protein [Rhizoctonia solani AG-1 IA]